jgi:hypothetical protein
LEERIKYCLAKLVELGDKFGKITTLYRNVLNLNEKFYGDRCNNLKNTELEHYSLLNQNKGLIEIVRITKSTRDTSTTMSLSVDPVTLNLFITIQQKTIVNGVSSTVLTNYIFPPADQVQYKYLNDEEYKNGDNQSDFLDFVISTRFDPRPVSGAGGNVHANYFSTKRGKLFTDSVEEGLYKKYYGETAEVPHFHFYEQRVTSKYGNNYSLAITPKNISRYLKDLANPNNTILRKHDLGMPFLNLISSNNCDFNIPNIIAIISTTEEHAKNEECKQKVKQSVQKFNNSIEKVRAFKMLSFEEKALFLAAYFEFIDNVSKFVFEDFQCELAKLSLECFIIQKPMEMTPVQIGSILQVINSHKKFEAKTCKEAVQEYINL